MHKDKDKDKDSNRQKIVITMRHGERADFAGLKPKYGRYDPELTNRGELQAFEAGKILYEQLKMIGFDINTVKIKVYTSPFLRTMQTGRELIKGYNSVNTTNACNKEIILNYQLSEQINWEFNNNFPKSFLNSIKKGNEFNALFKEIKISELNSIDELPYIEEDDELMSIRMKKVVKAVLNNEIEKNNDSDSDVLVLISHGTPISEMNLQFGYDGPYGYQYVNYCQMYYFSLDHCNKKAKYLSTIYPKQN